MTVIWTAAVDKKNKLDRAGEPNGLSQLGKLFIGS